jgi:hypothetical protein
MRVPRPLASEHAGATSASFPSGSATEAAPGTNRDLQWSASPSLDSLGLFPSRPSLFPDEQRGALLLPSEPDSRRPSFDSWDNISQALEDTETKE